MEGYDETTYGRAFADVYDEWYQGISDVPTSVRALADLALQSRTTARVLELGVGTGRLAVPLAESEPDRLTVVGIDASREMLDLLAARDPRRLVDVVVGDMVDDLPDGPFDLVVVAYNTLFNLTGDGRQQRCFEQVGARLSGGGRFVVEAFVPDERSRDGDDIAVRSMTASSVVLSISRRRAADQRAEGHFVELTEAGGVRLRPWSIRYATPAQLDQMANGAGLHLEARWHALDGSPFGPDSDRHVSIYRRRDS